MGDALALARAVHILGVVIWIGGVSMATTAVLSAVRRGDLGADLHKSFEAVERRFVWQARTAVVAVGASGFYMTWQLDLWDRFQSLSFWWMDAMVGVWIIFVFILFVAEPFILHRHFDRWVKASPETAFAWLHRAHWVLLTLAVITLFGAAAGSHGFLFM